jgi:hypothetical protein
VYESAQHISQAEFDEMDLLAWKLENGLKKLVESLQEKNPEEWSDTFLVKEETNEIYTTASDSFPPKNPSIRQSINPDLL